MTKRDASYINHIYTILAERDLIRRYLSSPPTQSLPPTPALLAYLVTNITTAHQFYSIYRSKACIESNRYPADIFAYDRTSVKLRYGDKGGKEGEGEYLNANVVRGEGETAWWVASQAPIPSTIHPFFLALLTRSATLTYQKIHDTSSSSSSSSSINTSTKMEPTRSRKRKAAILVQLTDFVEQGRRKADVYLPSSQNPILRYEPPTTLRKSHPSLQITYLSSKRSHSLSSAISRYSLSTVSTPPPTFSSSLLPRRTNSHGESRGQKWVNRVSSSTINGSLVSGFPQGTQGPDDDDDDQSSKNEMELHHYHFVGWPDHGVPGGENVNALKRLIDEVERKKLELKVEIGEDVEVWVHCSAGIGRTGTFIALSSLLHSISSSNPLPTSQPTSMLVPLPPDVQRDRVARVVDLLREQRGMMVQTREQLELIYLIADGEMRGV